MLLVPLRAGVILTGVRVSTVLS